MLWAKLWFCRVVRATPVAAPKRDALQKCRLYEALGASIVTKPKQIIKLKQ